MNELIRTLRDTHSLSLSQYEALIQGRTSETAALLADYAVAERKKIYGNQVYIRGLIEISNICKNDCFYCGIRKSNSNCARYRLTPDEILDCCDEGYRLGFRTFVLQGGEDGYFTDAVLCPLLRTIKERYSDCAVTLSLGERSDESYRALYDAGADRYLLRHETANRAHYGSLHPSALSFDVRRACLKTLKEIGYQVGCGFMVGSPNQTAKTLAEDLKFIEAFQPDMCGIGPFIPHCDTPFREHPAGDLDLTCYLLSILRLIKPNLLLPATTALGTLHPQGRERGILSGANVVMPNLSPPSVRKKYMLYNGKVSDGSEAAEGKAALDQKIAAIGYEIVTTRGDIKTI